MKAVISVLTFIFVVHYSFAEEKVQTLDDYLDKRIKLNIKYRDQFIELAKESSVSKDLTPLEKELGDEWVKYLKYARASKDKKLKAYALRLELLEEMRMCYYDLEVAEGPIEKLSLKTKIAQWRKQFAAINKLIEAK